MNQVFPPRRIPMQKIQFANRVVVTQCEEYPTFWGRLFRRNWTKPRMVTRVIKDRHTGIHKILSVRRMTVFETTMFEPGDTVSYELEYPAGMGCHDVPVA
jgi:hypothetical protein